MDNPLEFFVNSAVIGQSLLCMSLLLMRLDKNVYYVPLLVFFFANTVVTLPSLASTFWPEWEIALELCAMPAMFLLGPSLWLYVESLTQETPWKPEKRHIWHLWPMVLSIICVFLVATLSEDIRVSLFIDGSDIDVTEIYPALTIVFFIFLVLLWVILSGYYVGRSLFALWAYRRRIKDVFASDMHRELGWLAALVGVLCTIWGTIPLEVVMELSDAKWEPPRELEAFLELALVWLLSVWGLRQRPGFAQIYNQPAVSQEEVREETDTKVATKQSVSNAIKYARSALGEEQALRIAAKIDAAMKIEKLYLDANLSLLDLAKHVRVSTNFLSQTLNETVGERFFDYVNRWRVNDAIPKVIASDATIIDIAFEVGFNSRSAFYKAFKRQTGMTPGDFRKQKGEAAGVVGSTVPPI